MSRENVEVVRRVHDAAARRDVPAVLALYDPGVELDATRVEIVGIGQGVYRGHDGLRSFFREWHEAWENVEYDFEELIDAGEQVISVVTRRARGRASGVDVEWHVALVWTLREGRVTRLVWFPSREDALEATDPSEED
jgi:ketosteroid isomerase-like protein